MANIFNESIQGVKLLMESVELLKTDLKELATQSKKTTESLKFKKSQEFKTLEQQIKVVSLAQKELIKIEKEEVKLKKELASLEKLEAQAIEAKNKKTIQGVRLEKELQAEERESIRVKKERANLLKVEAQALKAKQSAQIQARKEEERQIKISQKLKNETKKLNDIYARESRELAKLSRDFKNLVLAGRGAEKATVALGNKVKRLRNRIVSADRAVGDFRREVGNYRQALTGSLGTVGQFATGAGAIAASVLIAGKALRSMINIVKNFEQSNANLQAVLRVTKEEMQPLIIQAKALGSSTAFSATQVTELQTELAKLGFPISDIQQMAASTLDAATAMGSDLGAQAKLTGATLKAFGLDASQTQRVNDVLALSTSKSALDFEKLSSSMSTIAPVAKSFGFSLEGSVSLLGELSNAGFDASSAATATRNIILKLADTNSTLSKSLKEPVKDLPSLVRGLKQLKSEGTDLGKALNLTSTRSVAAFATFLEGTDSVLELNEALKGAQGTAAEMAAIQLDTLDGSLKILNSSWEGLILSMEDGSGVMNNISRKVVDDLAKGLSIISGESKEAKKQFSFLGFIMTGIKNQFNILVGVVKILLIPWRIMIDLVINLASRFDFLKGIISGASGSLTFFVQLLNNIPEITDIVINAIIKSFSRISDVILGSALIFKGFFSNITDGFAFVGKTIVQFGKLLGKVVISGIKGDVGAIKVAFKAFGKTLGDNFKDLAKNKDVLEGGILVAQAFADGLGDFKEAKKKIEDLFKDAKDKAAEISDVIPPPPPPPPPPGGDPDKKAAKARRDALNQQNKDFNALLLSRKSRAVTLAKEFTEQEKNLLNISEMFSQERLDSTISAIDRETKVLLEQAKLRTSILLENDKLTKIQRKKITEEGIEAERIIINNAEKEKLDLIKSADEKRIAQEEMTQKEILELRKQAFQNRLKFLEDALDKGIQAEREAHKERLALIDTEIKASKDLQASLKEDAAAGKANAKENLVFAREQERKATLARQAEVEKQKRIEEGLAFIKLLTANAGNPNIKNPIVATIKQHTAARLFIASLSSLLDGTEDTGTVNKPLDSKGGRLSVLHDNERVVPKKDNEKMSGITNSELGFMAEQYKLGKLVDVNRQHQALHVVNNYQSNKEMIDKMDELNSSIKRLPKDMPQVREDWDDKEKMFTYTVKQKGKVTKKIYNRKGGLWG